jgi:catechol 2,3-dioxygenase-like lactoylglutathione lyase family enzyme
MIKINESNVTIMVKDMDKAISFYESIGLTIKNRWGNHYAMLVAKGITIGIHPSDEKKNSSGTVSVGFMISDINEAKETLDKNNIKYEFQDDDKSGDYLHFKDHDGTILYYVKPKW